MSVEKETIMNTTDTKENIRNNISLVGDIKTAETAEIMYSKAWKRYIIFVVN